MKALGYLAAWLLLWIVVSLAVGSVTGRALDIEHAEQMRQVGEWR